MGSAMFLRLAACPGLKRFLAEFEVEGRMLKTFACHTTWTTFPSTAWRLRQARSGPPHPSFGASLAGSVSLSTPLTRGLRPPKGRTFRRRKSYLSPGKC